MKKPNLTQFIKEVRKMRLEQKSFFATRKKVYLQRSIAQEKVVDKMLKEIQLWEQNTFVENQLEQMAASEKQSAEAFEAQDQALREIKEQIQQEMNFDNEGE